MTAKLVLRELSRYPIGTFADIIYRNASLAVTLLPSDGY